MFPKRITILLSILECRITRSLSEFFSNRRIVFYGNIFSCLVPVLRQAILSQSGERYPFNTVPFNTHSLKDTVDSAEKQCNF